MEEQGLDQVLSGESDSSADASSELAPQPLAGEDLLNADSGNVDIPGAELLSGEAPQPGVKTKEESPSPEPKKDEPPEHIPYKAFKSEREKRQAEVQRRRDLEREVAKLQGQIEAFSKNLPAAPKAAPVKDKTPEELLEEYFQDPTEFTLKPVREVRKDIESFKQQTHNALAQMQQRSRLEVSQAMMRTQHQDFDEVIDGFVDIAQNDPTILYRFQNADNPALYAYKHMKARKGLDGASTIEELEAKIADRLRPQIEAEIRKQSVQRDAAQVTTSTASAQNAGVSPAFHGDLPLSKILEDR
jgi:hypothetical protein